MNADTSFWIQMVVYALSFGAMYGAVTTRLETLEATVAKHNNIVERTYKVEESTKNAHRRIDELREEVNA